MDKVNIKRLAEELKLSTSTISRALQDSYQIGAETKQRVLELAKKLNYQPNAHASSLGSRRSKTIAVVIPEVFDSYFALAINGIEAVAQARGYHVLIYLTHERLQLEQEILHAFQSGRVDGVVMSVSAETTSTAHIQALRAQGVPVVFFDRAADDIDTARVTTNDAESTYQGTCHLLERQCTTLVLLSISRHLSISRQRIEGYRRALAEHGISQRDDVIDCGQDPEANCELVKNTLEARPGIDGIISTVEMLTESAYQACAALHLRIPHDVKVVSFYNARSAAILNPSLTTISQPAFEMGKTAATLLLKALRNPKSTLVAENVVLPSVLTIRNSTTFVG
ncbi:LacI family DNA-binding transcriptional regulator [Hymenobacter coccineus]|uniref:LacI family transcriptional regulator n=1 Tax=Hymenobacter coccineus TaxID=1908235 RepID=A0A1G1SSC8_9BACT|nr:LacI family DNA-binding transcriptional regulator [Hymenobacter coccineus]OGX81516.1 LacI family transcriptional regulator [Hymenobacter coccineus]